MFVEKKLQNTVTEAHVFDGTYGFSLTVVASVRDCTHAQPVNRVFLSKRLCRRSRGPCGLRPLDSWYLGFESRLPHGCYSLVFDVCYVGSGLWDKLVACSESPTGCVWV